ncbi:hypothetical protein ACHAWF_005555 [Thalassiosira exigua]
MKPDTASSCADKSRWESFARPEAPFPSKLYGILEFAEQKGLIDSVSWLPDGQSFKIHNSSSFMSLVATKFFKATKVPREKDAWYHDKFIRDQPELIEKMVRIKVKGNRTSKAKSRSLNRSVNEAIANMSNIEESAGHINMFAHPGVFIQRPRRISFHEPFSLGGVDGCGHPQDVVPTLFPIEPLPLGDNMASEVDEADEFSLFIDEMMIENPFT